ncbi:MAG: hypothetical protein NTW78_03820 [Campylobacterales bacterium]|nr:hypothetical protein [Campylobacterales bacterium]
MGWYDAFKGNTAAINMNSVTSDTGSAAKNFGDAFVSIGKDMRDANTQAKKDELTALQLQNEQFKLDTAKTSDTEAKVDKSFLKDAYSLDRTVPKEAQKNATDALESFYNPTTTARDKLKDAWKTQDDLAQVKFNDEATKTAVNGSYKNMKEFEAANPALVKNADGLTMAKLDAHYDTKDTQASKLATAQSKMENASALLDVKREMNNINAEKNQLKTEADKSNKYSQETDTKIANIVAKGMGLDANSIDSWSKDKQAEYLTTTTGVAQIAKQYNVTPLIAIDMYSKLQAKKTEVPTDTKKSNWKDYE